MKKTIIPLLALFMASVISCQKDGLNPYEEKGSLCIDIGLDVRVKEVNNKLKAGQTDNFKVIVYHASGIEAIIFQTVSLMPDTIELVPGDYYVVAHSDNNLPAAFENPWYYGESEVFSIRSNQQQSVQVNCTLANTIVSVTYSDTTINSFEDYTTTVSTSTDSLVYTKDETRWGYFQPEPMEILVELDYLDPDGSVNNKTLSGSIPNPAPNKHYEIHINASPDQGMASFLIFMDESVIPVEMIELNDNPATPPAGSLTYGDILITEIMPDPSALSDTEGEWFEIYNNSVQTINLQNLVIERNDINSHVISDSIELAPGEYYVMSRSETATDAANSYIYGSAITLSNTGAVLSIYNENSENGPGALIFSLDYGGANFPSPTGASINLNPNFLDAAYAVMGAYWCISTSSFSTGDLGTPGLPNDLCE